MNQVFHIFRKDLRHFWPEILVSFTVTAAFIWIYPYQWHFADKFTSTSGFLDLHHLQLLANTITGLLPVSWMLLVSRVVHAENLVGNRQFWLTRPYQWTSLLAEKCLFFFCFICLPFFFAQAALLARADFPPSQYIGALIFNLLLICVVTLLPFFCLASTISSLLRIIGTLLVLTGIVVAIAFFVTSFSAGDPSMSVPYSDRISVPLIISICIAVLIIQYSARRLWLSRALLITVPVLIAMIAASPFDLQLLEHAYPASHPGTHEVIEANLPDGIETTWSASPEDSKHVSLRLPYKFRGIPSAHAVSTDNVRLMIDARDGLHWASRWQAVYNQRHLSDDPAGELRVVIDRKFYTQVQGLPVAVRIDLALTETQPQMGKSTKTSYLEDTSITLPDGGICDYEPAELFRFAQFFCRVPFHHPQLTRVTTVQSSQPCGHHRDENESVQEISSWVGSLDPDIADIGLTPVWTDSISFSNNQVRRGEDSVAQQLDLCPGSPVVMTPYRLTRRFRENFTVRNAQLPVFRIAPDGTILLRKKP